MPTDCEIPLFERACASEVRRAERAGAPIDQPCARLSTIEWRRDGTAVIALRSRRGEIGRWCWTGRRLVAA